MRNNSSGAGCLGVTVAVALAFVVGALLVVALVRADVFKTQPSQAAVSAAYAARAKIEAEAAREKLAADLAHEQNVAKINEQFMQTGKDLLIVAGGVAVLGLLVGVGAGGYRAFSHAHAHASIIRPNKRGQLPMFVDKRRGLLINPNMQTTAALQLDNPQELAPELQIEAFAWSKRADIAASLSQTKTFAATAVQERGLLRATALPSETRPGSALPPPIVIGGAPDIDADDDSGIHMHDDPAAIKPSGRAATFGEHMRTVVNTSNGDMPGNIDSEEAFNDFIKRRNQSA